MLQVERSFFVRRLLVPGDATVAENDLPARVGREIGIVGDEHERRIIAAM
jgi:hypothetical protein